MGKRCINIESFLRNSMLTIWRHRRDRSHIVQSIGKFDEQHPKIFCHRDEHLAHRRRLLCLPRIKLQAVELGHTVNNRGNVFAEISAQVIKRKFSIFNCVMQQSG